MNIQLSKIAIYISYQSSHTDRLRVALIAAFLLHLLILILIPKIPEFRIPSASRDAALNVFLRTQDEVEKFEQVLNQPNDAENTENPITEPSRAAASADRGEDDLVTEESPVVESASADKLETESGLLPRGQHCADLPIKTLQTMPIPGLKNWRVLAAALAVQEVIADVVRYKATKISMAINTYAIVPPAGIYVSSKSVCKIRMNSVPRRCIFSAATMDR